MITEHQLREHAYYIWEKQGRCAGQAEAHWHQAQAELQAVGAETTAPVKAKPKAAKPPASRAKVVKAPVAARKAPRAAAADTAALH